MLGQLGGEAAILHLQRTVLPTDKAQHIVSSLEDVTFFLENQPVSVFSKASEMADEIVLFCPCHPS